VEKGSKKESNQGFGGITLILDILGIQGGVLGGGSYSLCNP
jgi:hypothetical protein